MGRMLLGRFGSDRGGVESGYVRVVNGLGRVQSGWKMLGRCGR